MLTVMAFLMCGKNLIIIGGIKPVLAIGPTS